MLPNELFALACRAYYDEEGFIVDKTNGQFAHSPLTRKECDTGYYLLWGHHQHQGLLQSKDLDKCCFFVGHTFKWLKECDYFPENYFELWDIYEKYASTHSVRALGKVHEEKDELGRSLNAVRGATVTNQERDGLGRSMNAVRGGEKSKRSRSVIATNKKGVQIVFSSIISCSKEFGVNESAVRKWIREERLPKGKARGWNFTLDG